MLEGITTFFRKLVKPGLSLDETSKDAAKERLHLVLMQDRANVSADFLDLMKQEIIEVIKKYVDVDEKEIDVRLTNQPNADGTNGAPALYANIPIVNIKNDVKGEKMRQQANETTNQTTETKKESIVKNAKEVKKDNSEDKNNNDDAKKERKSVKTEKIIKTDKDDKIKEVEKTLKLKEENKGNNTENENKNISDTENNLEQNNKKENTNDSE